VNGQLMREVRALLARRQPALGYLVALAAAGVGTDLLVAAAVHQLPSFSQFARREFSEDVLWRGVATLGHGSPLAWLAVVFAIVASAAIAGWLRACYLIALGEGRYGLRAPRRIVTQLVLYWLVLELFFVALTALADAGQGGIALVVQLLSTPAWLYAEYAIVFDETSLLRGSQRSLQMFRVRSRASILAVLLLFIASALAYGAFTNGFTDSTHVQATYLGAWELVEALVVFVTDVVLLTLYRRTRLSEGESAAS
jgi:hypothetical protein